MTSLKVIAFNASPRKNGNTFDLMSVVLEELERKAIRTELMHIGGRLVRGCIDCRKCLEYNNLKCVIDDWVNEAIEKMLSADGILLGSPAYFGDLTPEVKAMIDRAGRVTRVDGVKLRRKVGAAVSTARRAAGVNVLDSLQRFFTINEMVVVTSCYWNVGYGLDPGDVKNDSEAMMVMKHLGENMAWVMKKLGGLC